MNLIQQLLQGNQQAQQPKAPQQSEVPASLMAMLSQGQSQPHANIIGMLSAMGGGQQQAPEMRLPQLPEIDTKLAAARYEAEAKQAEEEKKRLQALKEAEIFKQLAPQLYGDIQKQNLNPLQQSFARQAQALAESGVPSLQKLATDMTKDFQTGATGILGNQISPTATMKDITSMNLEPGSTGFNEVMRGTLLKPITQINMGGEYMQPATVEQKRAWGIPVDVPAVHNQRTGEVQARPTNITEDQGKSSMNLNELSTGLSSMRKVLTTKTMNPSEAKQDYIGSTLVNTGIPVIEDFGKSLQSSDQQEFDQAAAQIKTGVVHLLSGQGFTGAELDTKVKAYVPVWGEKPEAINKKLNSVEQMAEKGARRAGSLSSPKLDLPPPTPGMTMNGFVFIGGDPAKQENWRPQ